MNQKHAFWFSIYELNYNKTENSTVETLNINLLRPCMEKPPCKNEHLTRSQGKYFGAQRSKQEPIFEICDKTSLD